VLTGKDLPVHFLICDWMVGSGGFSRVEFRNLLFADGK